MIFGLCPLLSVLLQLAFWAGSSAAACTKIRRNAPELYRSFYSAVEEVKASTTALNLLTLNEKLRTQGGVYSTGHVTYENIAEIEKALGLHKSPRFEVVLYTSDNVHHYPQVIVRQTRGDARYVPEPLLPEEKNRLPFPGLPEEVGVCIVERVLSKSFRDFLELRHVSKAWRVALRALRRKVLREFEARDGDLLTNGHLAFVSDILQVQFRPEVAYRVVERYVAGKSGPFRDLASWSNSRNSKRRAKIGQRLLKDHYPLARLAAGRMLVPEAVCPAPPYTRNYRQHIGHGLLCLWYVQFGLALVVGVFLGILSNLDDWSPLLFFRAARQVFTAIWMVSVTHMLLPKELFGMERYRRLCSAIPDQAFRVVTSWSAVLSMPYLCILALAYALTLW